MKAALASITPFDRTRVADRILDDLRARIASGELPRGARLPTERELAEQYRVSGATIREAVRGLTATGFIEVRHGSGAYVTAANDCLVTTALGALIQLEEVSIADILGVLAMLHLHAVELALVHASDADIDVIDATIKDLSAARTADTLADALIRFLRALSAATHNPLVAGLCNFLSELQVRLALDLSRRSDDQWRRMTGALRSERIAIATALRKRDRDQAVDAMRRFQAAALRLVNELPYGKRKRIPCSPLAGALTAMRDAGRSRG